MIFVISDTYNSSYFGKYLKESQNLCCLMPGAQIPYENCLKKAESFDFENKRNTKKIFSSLEDSHEFLKETFPKNKNVKQLDLLKNKYLFRETVKKIYPDYEYKLYTEDTTLFVGDLNNRPKVMKPVSGIASKGVKVLKDLPKGSDVRISATKESPILVEDYIDGIELAVDGFYDSSGLPVVLNIMQHDFISDKDVSDTLYYTNFMLVEKHISKIVDLLHSLNLYFDLESFPFHLEVRVDKNGNYIPIEINPFRFSGYGTCEIVDYAYGINPYKILNEDYRPDWSKIGNTLPAKTKLNNFGFVTIETELEIDHQKASSMFSELLEYRLINMPNSNIKAIIFFKENNKEKLKDLLKINDFIQK